jgi:zinc protease
MDIQIYHKLLVQILNKAIAMKIQKQLKIILLTIILLGEIMGNTNLPKYYEQTLNNGLKVIAIPLHNNTGVISTDIFYNVGSRDEVMGKSGIAHMLEHLNFKSTKNLQAGEFDKIVKSFGGVNNASTGFDYTHYYVKSSANNLAKSLELYADMMENLQLKDEEFQPERDVVIEERLWRTDNNPVGYLYFKLFNNTYTYHPYHWTPIGFMEDIKNWKIEDIQAFHKKFYTPSNATIVVSGDINEEEVFANATKYFANIKNTNESNKIDENSYMIEPKQDGAKRIIIKKDVQTQTLAINFHIPNYLHKDQVALSALSELLSSGKSSRLSKVIVNDKQLASNVHGYNMELKDPGVFMFMAMCNPGVDAKEVEALIWDEIKKIQKGNIYEEELDKIKINTKADFIFSLESSSSVSSLFGSYFSRGDISPLLNYEKRINKLKIKDIVKVAKKYFTKDNSTTIILKK